jgi:hypothetical protein
MDSRLASRITGFLLQAKLPPAVIPEQTAISDITPHHLHATVPGLVHDRALGRPCNRGTCRMPGSKGVSRVLRCFEARALAELRVC